MNLRQMYVGILIPLTLMFLSCNWPKQELKEIIETAPIIVIDELTIAKCTDLVKEGVKIEGKKYSIIYQDLSLLRVESIAEWKEKNVVDKLITDKDYVIGKINFCTISPQLLIYQEPDYRRGSIKRIVLNRYECCLTRYNDLAGSKAISNT